MKKLILVLMLVGYFVSFGIMVMPAFSQTMAEVVLVEDGFTLPEVPFGLDPHAYVANFYVFVATIIFLTGLINRLLQWTDRKLMYLSWGVALVVSLIAFFFELGMFVAFDWWHIPLYVIAFAAGSNGLAQWPVLNELLLGLKFKVKST